MTRLTRSTSHRLVSLRLAALALAALRLGLQTDRRAK